jgi:predicted  nucleic acid-binding Zn-ribbon protein
MSRSLNLYRLQKFDTQLDLFNNRLIYIENSLADKTSINQAEEALFAAEIVLQNNQKELRGAENKVKDQRLKIEQTEAILYGGRVRNPKELQDLQNEAAALKRYLEVLEDRQLEAMLEVDEASAIVTRAQGKLDSVIGDAETLNHSLITERGNIRKDVEQIEVKREATLSSIPISDLDLYNSLRDSRAGVAVAMVNDKACSACGSTLSAALFQAARTPNQLTRCETCGRILYAV